MASCNVWSGKLNLRAKKNTYEFLELDYHVL